MARNMDNERVQSAFLRAVRGALLPLVRLMLARGLHFPAAAEMLKSLYVEVAEREFALDSKRQTDSRISLLTGVYRKDVKRLRLELPEKRESMPRDVSLGAQIVAAWNANPLCVDGEGVPKPLARFAQDGGEQSFEALVKGVSRDMHPRVVLDEWLRRGIVVMNEKNEVCLRAEAFIPEEGYAEKMFYLGHNLHDHAAAAVQNVMSGKPPTLERCVHYEGLAAADVEAIADSATKFGMRALRAVNSRAADAVKLAGDAVPLQPTRLTFGVYFYSEAQPLAETTATESAA